MQPLVVGAVQPSSASSSSWVWLSHGAVRRASFPAPPDRDPGRERRSATAAPDLVAIRKPQGLAEPGWWQRRTRGALWRVWAPLRRVREPKGRRQDRRVRWQGARSPCGCLRFARRPPYSAQSMAKALPADSKPTRASASRTTASRTTASRTTASRTTGKQATERTAPLAAVPPRPRRRPSRCRSQAEDPRPTRRRSPSARPARQALPGARHAEAAQRPAPPAQQARLRALRAAFAAGCARNLSGAFRLCHYAVLNDHLHLICEAEGRTALSRGLQGLLIRIARALNKLWSRRGSVFADRYHDHILKSPREVRNALRYVFGNGQEARRRRPRGPRAAGDRHVHLGAVVRRAFANASPCAASTRSCGR
jgi:hypothetical protein